MRIYYIIILSIFLTKFCFLNFTQDLAKEKIDKIYSSPHLVESLLQSDRLEKSEVSGDSSPLPFYHHTNKVFPIKCLLGETFSLQSKQLCKESYSKKYSGLSPPLLLFS